MWWSEPRGIAAGLIALALALSGCGFRPLYGAGSPAAALQDRIALGTVTRNETPDRMGFTLQDELRGLLGRDVADPLYRIDIRLKVVETGLAIATDNTTTRYNLTATAFWTLKDKTGADALEGETRSFTAYSATATLYATRIAQRDAERRLATDLAQRIATEIAARAAGLAPKTSPDPAPVSSP